MDSGSTVTGTSMHNKRKRDSPLQKGGDEDIITKLPESLISHILSILPTKDAVRTSVLSKRWMHLWKSVTKLDLNDRDFFSPAKTTCGKQHFVNFVNTALHLIKSSSFDNFSLVIGNDEYDASLINTLISRVLTRSLKKLCFHSQIMGLPVSSLTSHSLLNCQSLEELELNTYSYVAVEVPSSCVRMGHLKVLKLRGIRFTLDSSNHSKHLTLSFPVLQKFDAVNCTWLGAECVTFKVPRLESVLIIQGPRFHKANCSLLEFSASHLTEFIYSGTFCSPQLITLLDPSSAHNASAFIISCHSKEDEVLEAGLRAFMLLTQFTQVKYLSFDGSEILPQSRVAHLPAFGMLSHLKLGLVSGEVLLALLLKSPVLEILAFEGLQSEFDRELLDSAVVPDCLLYSLQLVKFEQVHGHEHELRLAKFLLKNGLVLSGMYFNRAAQIGKSKRAFEEFKERLFSFKKGSSFATVEFFV